MSKKPIYSVTDKVGKLAVSYCQTLFEEEGWIFRKADGTTDFGIDAEVEIVDDNEVTGKLFKCQIKGTETINWTTDLHIVNIKVATWNNWSAINLPVIALLVDIKSKDIYWSLPLAHVPQEKASNVALKFYRSENIKERFADLRAIIETWLENFPHTNILREVPFFHQLYYTELKNTVDWGDPWMEIGNELNQQTRLFYKHVLELRLSVGLTNEKIFPLEFWFIRNSAIWEGSFLLYYGTFSELIAYLTPFYEEALTKLQARLKNVEPKFENNEIINYFKLDPLLQENRNMTLFLEHPWVEKEQFHYTMDAVLKKMGVLRFSWFKKRRK